MENHLYHVNTSLMETNTNASKLIAAESVS